MSKKSAGCGSAGNMIGAEVKFAGNDSKSKMYGPKHKRKLVRVLTVIAYIFSVSLAAITLSLFYLFIYNPGKPGHNLGQSNSSANEKLFGKYNEDVMLPFNRTYANYDREEPRALPLESIQQHAPMKRSISTFPSQKEQKKGISDEDGYRVVKKSSPFISRIIKSSVDELKNKYKNY